MHRIAVAGHVCLDIAPGLRERARLDPGQLVEVGPLAITLGGSVANTGRALVDLGASVTPFATVGDDELGRLLFSKLRALGFDAPRLTISQTLATSYSIVIQEPGVDRIFWHHTGANDEFDGSGVDASGYEMLHVGYPTLLPGLVADGGRALTDLLARARQAGVTTSLDLAVVDPSSMTAALDWDSILTSTFAHTDIASPSVDDLVSALGIDEPYSPNLVDELADRMLTEGVAVAAISAGSYGLRVRTGSPERLRSAGAVLEPLADSWANRAFSVPPLSVEHAVTTNGAGDASTAGLLYALSRGATPEQAAALAAASSASVIGGRRPTPDAVRLLSPSLTDLLN